MTSPDAWRKAPSPAGPEVPDALPAVAGAAGFAVLRTLDVGPVAAFLTLLAFQALGYIGGVFYSLSYIRKVALIKQPSACVKPSIITFCVLAVLGLGANVAGLFAQHAINRIVGTVALVGFYAAICFAFAIITRQGFSRMEPRIPE